MDAAVKAIEKNAKNFNEFQTDRLERYIHYYMFNDTDYPNIILPEFTDPLASYDANGLFNDAEEGSDAGWVLYQCVYNGSDKSYQEDFLVNMWISKWLYKHTKYGKRYGTIE